MTPSARSLGPLSRLANSGRARTAALMLLSASLGAAAGVTLPKISCSSSQPRASTSPDYNDLSRALEGVEDQVRACVGERSGSVQVLVTFRGSTGRVASAKVAGSYFGSELPEENQRCIEDAVREANVPPFEREAYVARHTYEITQDSAPDADVSN